jgi:hypothetical protein
MTIFFMPYLLKENFKLLNSKLSDLAPLRLKTKKPRKRGSEYGIKTMAIALQNPERVCMPPPLFVD